MDYLAKAIVDLFTLFQQLFIAWVNGEGNIAVEEQGVIGNSIASIFANGVNFFAELTSEVTKQMSNIAQ
ncbi:MAG: hypothetical protein FJ004_09755 [Chloroflexi bacterium]|nr:hypothetical protein [Chloroflexota bacterium]